jgi:hypothetical protein
MSKKDMDMLMNSPVYFDNPDLFEHYYGDYVYIYESPEAPIHNFIRNSFGKNYNKCYEACLFVLKSYSLGKCKLSLNYYQILKDKRERRKELILP